MKTFFAAFFGSFFGALCAMGLCFAMLAFAAQAVAGYIQKNYKGASSEESIIQKMQKMEGTLGKFLDEAQKEMGKEDLSAY